MTLPAGKLSFTLEYGKGLKDRDVFGRQDPYGKVTCGSQTFRSKTHTDGGKNPVWNQTFTFGIINENTVVVDLWDEDTLTRDDKIGSCTVSLARARQMGSDHQQVAIMCPHTHKQHGFISCSMTFQPNQAAAPPPGAYAPYPPPAYAPYGAHAPPQQFQPQPSYHYQPSFAPPPYQPQPSYHYQQAPAAYLPQPSFQAPPPYQSQPSSYHAPPAYQPQPSFHAPPPQQAPSPYQPQPQYGALAAPPPGSAAPSAPPPPYPASAPANTASSIYPTLPTTQQFYPGVGVPPGTGSVPPPIAFS